MENEEKIRGLFLGPDLRWLADRLHTRVRRGEPLASGMATLAGATDVQRSAVDSLLGRKSTRGKSLTVSLAALAEKLRAAELADDLGEVVAACFGEVANERDLRDAATRAWRDVFDEARDVLGAGDVAGIAWLDSMEGDGLLKRFTQGDPDLGRELLGTAVRIWNGFPQEGETLAELGGRVTGDTHALDRGRALSPVLLRGLKFRNGFDGNKGAEMRRRAWDSVGVVVDRLSSPVLTFNLEAQAKSVLGRVLALHREAGLPIYLTYQMLCAHGKFCFGSEDAPEVFVVENPALVEIAASRLGKSCRPLICTEGIPASAAKLLMRHLAEAGCRLRVRADFDWTGLRIVDQLLAIPNATPWRMDTETYGKIAGTVELDGARFSAPWCADLSEAMAAVGTAGFEEQISGGLVSDLDGGQREI